MTITPTSPRTLLPARGFADSERDRIESSGLKRVDWSTGDIFDAIVLRVCKVTWIFKGISVETTGCFVKHFLSQQIRVLTCFHDIEWKNAKIQICYNTRVFGAHPCTDISIEAAALHDVCLIDIPKEQLFDLSYFEIENINPKLRHGDKIYFAGFPLSKDYPISHKGYISSTSDDQTEFNIDGTVVRGHSGGPVVCLIGDRLRLVGIINSQAVDMTKKLLEASQVKQPKYFAHNDVPSTFGTSNVNSVLHEVIRNLISNVSTGIGNARMITNVSALFAEEDEDIESPLEAGIDSSKQEDFRDDYGAEAVMNDMMNADPMLFARSRTNVPVIQTPTHAAPQTPTLATRTSAVASQKVTELPVGRDERFPQAIRHRKDLYHEQKKKGKLNSIVGGQLGAKDKVEKKGAIAVGDHLDKIVQKKKKAAEERKEKDAIRREKMIQAKEQNSYMQLEAAVAVLIEVEKEIQTIQADASKLTKQAVQDLLSKVSEVETKRFTVVTEDEDASEGEDDSSEDEDLEITAFLERCKFISAQLRGLEDQRKKGLTKREL